MVDKSFFIFAEKKIMTLKETIEQRYSVRSYLPEMPTKEQLYSVIESARLAPSAVNYQPWKFFVVTKTAIIGELQRAYNREWFKSAPCIIVVCGNHSESWHRGYDGKDHCDIDVAIATEHIALAAVEQGLGTCWVCNFDTSLVSQALNLPSDIEPIVMLPIGKPCGEHKATMRKTIEDVVVWL